MLLICKIYKVLIASENERLNNALRQRTDEIESWKNKYMELDGQRRRDIQDYDNRFRGLEQENKLILKDSKKNYDNMSI